MRRGDHKNAGCSCRMIRGLLALAVNPHAPVHGQTLEALRRRELVEPHPSRALSYAGTVLTGSEQTIIGLDPNVREHVIERWRRWEP